MRKELEFWSLLLVILASLLSGCDGKSKDQTAEIATGQRLYLSYGCGACHGRDGSGNGPAAANLKKHPRNFHLAASFHNGRTVESISRTIAGGFPDGAMPASPFIRESERRLIALYVLSLAPGELPEGVITVTGAWIREVLPGQDATAGYMMLKNTGSEPDFLVGAACDCAGTVEAHRMVGEAGEMRMESVQRLEVPAKGTVELAPGGIHLMLFGVRNSLRDGASVRLTLRFEKSGNIEVETQVRASEGKKHDP